MILTQKIEGNVYTNQGDTLSPKLFLDVISFIIFFFTYRLSLFLSFFNQFHSNILLSPLTIQFMFC